MNKLEHGRIKKLGPITHFSDLGYAVVINPSQLPKIGSNVVTETMEHIGSINDIFGPVKKPYISIKIKEQYKEKIQVKTILYSIDRKKKDVRQKRSNSKKLSFHKQKQ